MRIKNVTKLPMREILEVPRLHDCKFACVLFFLFLFFFEKVRFDLSVWSTSSAGLKDPLTHVSLSVLEWGPNDWFQERTGETKTPKTFSMFFLTEGS